MTAIAAETAVVASVRSSGGGGLRAGRHRRLQVFRAVVLVVLGLFFLLPLFALLEFSTRGIGLTAPRTLDAWQRIVTDTTLFPAIVDTLELAALTSIIALVLMVPTMVWVRLRLPRLARMVEFCCLLPLTIPAIVLVVGLAPVYRGVNAVVGDSILTLFFAYVVLVLPYVYRSLDTGLQAMDVRTLSEAARSLGASWATVMVRIIVPNMTAAVLNAGLLSVAIVMGEFTIANLFHYVNLQVAILQFSQSDASLSVATSAASLMFAFLLLLLLSFAGRRRRGSAVKED
jgi:putative spermidine/putrescine transport system permease protein